MNFGKKNLFPSPIYQLRGYVLCNLRTIYKLSEGVTKYTLAATLS